MSTDSPFHPAFGGQWSPEPDPPDGYDEWPTMGYAAAAWISHHTGLRLDPWQVEILRRGMAYHPDTLDWLHEDVLIVGPEAIGKSAKLGGLGCWWLDGPCMPPVEAPQAYPDPNIPVLAAALSLTQHIRNYASSYVDVSPATLQDRIECENRRLYRKGAKDPDSEQLHVPASSGALQEGGNPRPVIIEEELHTLNAMGVKSTGVDTIKIYSGKRTKTSQWVDQNGDVRPLTVQRWTITNPDDGDPDSLLGKRWARAERILSGELVDDKVLVVWFHAAEPVDIDDPDDLRRGIREANPASWQQDQIDAIARKYEKGDQTGSRCRRMSLGLFWAGSDQVVPEGVLEDAAVDPYEVGLDHIDQLIPPPDVPIALAFDGARNRDSISLEGCTPEGYGFGLALWEPPEDRTNWRGHDKEAVHDRVVQAMDVDHPKALLAVDPTFFEDYAIRGWRNAAGDEVLAWVDRWPGRVILDVQQYGAAAWAAWLIAVKQGGWTFDGDPAMLRHMRNAKTVTRTRQGRTYEVLAKKRDDGQHPIDKLVAQTYAFRLAMTMGDHTGNQGTKEDWLKVLGGIPDGEAA